MIDAAGPDSTPVTNTKTSQNDDKKESGQLNENSPAEDIYDKESFLKEVFSGEDDEDLEMRKKVWRVITYSSTINNTNILAIFKSFAQLCHSLPWDQTYQEIMKMVLRVRKNDWYGF